MNDQQILEQIDMMIKNQLSNEETAKLKQKIRSDARLSEIYELSKLEHDAMEMLVEEDLYNQMAIWRKDENKVDKEVTQNDVHNHIGGTFTIHNLWKLAAAVLFIIVAGMWWWSTHQQSLYEQYYLPDPGLPTVMGEAEDFQFDQGMVDYKIEEYDKAINRWIVLYEKEPDNIKYVYYLGAAYQAKGELEKAEEHLMRSLELDDTRNYHDKARWFLGLIELKQGNKEQAKKWFELTDYHRAAELKSP